MWLFLSCSHHNDLEFPVCPSYQHPTSCSPLLSNTCSFPVPRVEEHMLIETKQWEGWSSEGQVRVDLSQEFAWFGDCGPS